MICRIINNIFNNFKLSKWDIRDNIMEIKDITPDQNIVIKTNSINIDDNMYCIRNMNKCCIFIHKEDLDNFLNNKKYCNNKNYMSYYSFFTTGNIVNREFCFDKLVNELDPFDYETYSNNNIDFYVFLWWKFYC